MKTKLILLSIFIIIVSSIFCFSDKKQNVRDYYIELGSSENALPSHRMFYLIETYSDSFSIPKHIAYSVAYKETRYRGPLDTLYNPYLVSKAGAVGAMQIMPKYASYFAGFDVTRSQVMKDLELNVWLSMKILAKHYHQYKNWGLACGAYNTGRPIKNDYAKFCEKNEDFTKKWVGPDSLKVKLF